MSFSDDLKTEIAKIFGDQWKTRDGQKVPESQDVQLGNHAVKLDGVVLYADLDSSTALVDTRVPAFAAEIYKAFLYSAAKVIRSCGGAITAYDGDRVMAVFIGDSKNSSAASCGLKINYAVTKLVQPALKKQYPKESYVVRHVVGIDQSPLFVARTGIRGSNDLVWVGRAANHAAKLSAQSAAYPTWITRTVYNMLNESAKYSSDGKNMWSPRTWNGTQVYTSTWWRSI